MIILGKFAIFVFNNNMQMYEYIKGAIAELTPACAVIDAGGVGYYLNISLHTYSQLEGQTEAKLLVHFIVREDAQIFYGFFSREERELFRLLLGVSGVGGASARMVLSTYSPEELRQIIVSENASLLKNVKGLGLKTAQKIIVDLKGKIASMPIGPGLSPGMVVGPGDSRYDEALAALSMLGFSRSSSEKTVRTLCRENPDAQVEEIIRIALKKL
ncbi:Holliday junction ATP-dependent DNA helicase RuvA [Bacteroidia bacterium]|nr:Holliday junction ATP-dependent DNA helicase RuvA [Bacteroidia bacterium]